MLNKLVTNAAKHGAGTINVAYKIIGDTHELSACDEGQGLANDFNPEQTRSGDEVVNALAKQLGGHMTAEANPTGRAGCACFQVAYRA
jgi:two-component sensor histidine kinase